MMCSTAYSSSFSSSAMPGSAPLVSAPGAAVFAVVGSTMVSVVRFRHVGSCQRHRGRTSVGPKLSRSKAANASDRASNFGLALSWSTAGHHPSSNLTCRRKPQGHTRAIGCSNAEGV
eukprot:6640086-Prymnesium_polylepis.1